MDVVNVNIKQVVDPSRSGGSFPPVSRSENGEEEEESGSPIREPRRRRRTEEAAAGAGARDEESAEVGLSCMPGHLPRGPGPSRPISRFTSPFFYLK